MKIDSANPIIIPTLVKLTQTNTDGWDTLDRRWSIIHNAAEALGEIGTGNVTAINALIELIQTTADRVICDAAIRNLGRIGIRNETAIAFLGDRNEVYVAEKRLFDRYYLLDVADSLVKIVPSDRLLQVVAALKGYLGKPYNNSSERYEAVYKTYPEIKPSPLGGSVLIYVYACGL